MSVCNIQSYVRPGAPHRFGDWWGAKVWKKLPLPLEGATFFFAPPRGGKKICLPPPYSGAGKTWLCHSGDSGKYRRSRLRSTICDECMMNALMAIALEKDLPSTINLQSSARHWSEIRIRIGLHILHIRIRMCRICMRHYTHDIIYVPLYAFVRIRIRILFHV